VALIEILKLLMPPGDRSAWLLLGSVPPSQCKDRVYGRLYGWKRLEATTPRKKNSDLH